MLLPAAPPAIHRALLFSATVAFDDVLHPESRDDLQSRAPNLRS